MNTDNTVKQRASLFDLDGVPKMSQAIPLALQHVVAMIVGCVTPAIIISGAAGIDTADRVLLIQASLVVSALATLLQLFPLGNKNGFHLGSGLPVILGVSFASMEYMLTFEDRGFSPNPYEAGDDRTYSLDALPQEYPHQGSGDFRSPAFAVEQAGRSYGLNLRYAGYEICKGKYSLPGLPPSSSRITVLSPVPVSSSEEWTTAPFLKSL